MTRLRVLHFVVGFLAGLVFCVLVTAIKAFVL
jgi:hypothetical protein